MGLIKPLIRIFGTRRMGLNQVETIFDGTGSTVGRGSHAIPNDVPRVGLPELTHGEASIMAATAFGGPHPAQRKRRTPKWLSTDLPFLVPVLSS